MGGASFAVTFDAVLTGSKVVGMEEIGVNSRSGEEWSGDWWLSGLVIFVDR